MNAENVKTSITEDNFPLKVSCYFFIIKNETLDKKYPGGSKVFANKFSASQNKYITLICGMSLYSLFQPIEQILEKYNFKRFTDFVIGEESLYYGVGETTAKEDEVCIDKTNWIQCKNTKHGNFVKFLN